MNLECHFETVDGQTHALALTPGIVYRWQKAHPQLPIAQAFDSNNYDGLLELAWEAAKTHGQTTQPCHQWVDTLKDSPRWESPKDRTSA